MIKKFQDLNQDELVDKVVYINRVAKVVKGGRRFSFSALVVVGDKKGKVGYGMGKANEVPEAIKKGFEHARKNLKTINLFKQTIPHQIIGRFGAVKVMLKPASEGTGVIAGGVVRSVMEVLGVQNIVSKCLGSTNPHNIVKATINGLESLKSEEAVSRIRGKNISILN